MTELLLIYLIVASPTECSAVEDHENVILGACSVSQSDETKQLQLTALNINHQPAQWSPTDIVEELNKDQLIRRGDYNRGPQHQHTCLLFTSIGEDTQEVSRQPSVTLSQPELSAEDDHVSGTASDSPEGGTSIPPTSHHQKVFRSKSEHDSRSLGLHEFKTLTNSSRTINTCNLLERCTMVHDCSDPSNICAADIAASPSQPESEDGGSDDEVCNSPKSFYLLRRLSHSLDHMIELEQAGIHSSDFTAVCHLSEILEQEVTPSDQIEKFLNTAETLTCHSTCNCADCQRVDEPPPTSIT